MSSDVRVAWWVVELRLAEVAKYREIVRRRCARPPSWILAWMNYGGKARGATEECMGPRIVYGVVVVIQYERSRS